MAIVRRHAASASFTPNDTRADRRYARYELYARFYPEELSRNSSRRKASLYPSGIRVIEKSIRSNDPIVIRFHPPIVYTRTRLEDLLSICIYKDMSVINIYKKIYMYRCINIMLI